MLVLGCAAGPAGAGDTYQEPGEFVREVFGGTPPQPERLWIDSKLKREIRQVTGHDPSTLRLRYWIQGERTAWILDEIGKEELITTGIVVDDGHISTLRILVFRETRGWEVRYPFFTDQFQGAALAPEGGLNRGIDGIAGATLSVRAVTRQARLALLLHHYAMSRNRVQR